MERATIFHEAFCSFAAHVLFWCFDKLPRSTLVVGDIGLDLLVECLEFLNSFSSCRIFLSSDLLFVSSTAVHSSTLLFVILLVIFFHDVLLGYSSEMTLVLVVSLVTMVNIVSVGDISTVK